MATAKKGSKPKTPAKEESEGMSSTMLIRLPAKLLKQIDAHVDAKQGERPGWSRSDFVREAIAKALRESEQ